ncbi:LysR family transcriptional regulator [Lysinibacillus xylanilyticus]|uniref:LysR family transcriptional regulator n=1 Tax=Lysinibacillus xylanilyticus TaxID=582475 RepID=UPI003CFFFD50
MDYKWIQSFIVAAKSCNFRMAAEELHLSQPSITVHIHQLEQSNFFQQKSPTSISGEMNAG